MMQVQEVMKLRCVDMVIYTQELKLDLIETLQALRCSFPDNSKLILDSHKSQISSQIGDL